MDRRSELPSVAAARTQRDLHLDNALRIERTYPTDASLDDEPTTLVLTTELVCGEMRSLTDRA